MNNNKTQNNGKELHNNEALSSSPLRIIQGNLSSLSEQDKKTLEQFEEDFSLRMLVEAESFYQLGVYAMTVHLLEVYTKLYSCNPYAWNRLGTAYSSLGDELKAIYCYEKACEMAPGDQDFMLNYADGLYKLGKIKETENVLTEHFRTSPKNKLYLYFKWYDAEFPMSIIKTAWRNRTKAHIKVVNEKPSASGIPNDRGQF